MQMRFRATLSLIQKLINHLPDARDPQKSHLFEENEVYYKVSGVPTHNNLSIQKAIQTRHKSNTPLSKEDLKTPIPQIFSIDQTNTASPTTQSPNPVNEILLLHPNFTGIIADTPPTAKQVEAARILDIPLLQKTNQ